MSIQLHVPAALPSTYIGLKFMCVPEHVWVFLKEQNLWPDKGTEWLCIKFNTYIVG
jgi:hypothetical protein